MQVVRLLGSPIPPSCRGCGSSANRLSTATYVSTNLDPLLANLDRLDRSRDDNHREIYGVPIGSLQVAATVPWIGGPSVHPCSVEIRMRVDSSLPQIEVAHSRWRLHHHGDFCPATSFGRRLDDDEGHAGEQQDPVRPAARRRSPKVEAFDTYGSSGRDCGGSRIHDGQYSDRWQRSGRPEAPARSADRRLLSRFLRLRNGLERLSRPDCRSKELNRPAAIAFSLGLTGRGRVLRAALAGSAAARRPGCRSRL
jgi:hypothetical protein